MDKLKVRIASCLDLPCLAFPFLALHCLALPCLFVSVLVFSCFVLPGLALFSLVLSCVLLPCLALFVLCRLAVPCLEIIEITIKNHPKNNQQIIRKSLILAGFGSWCGLGVPQERFGPWGRKNGRGTEFFERIFGRLWVPGATIGSPLGFLWDAFRWPSGSIFHKNL